MIRDVTSGKTGGIGAIRYADGGITSKIPVAYVVDGGKTVALFKENGTGADGLDDSYTFLYRYGA